jgi:hypothetical protein
MSERIPKIYFVLLSRGSVVLFGDHYTGNEKSFKLNFIAAFEMVSAADLLIYYIRPDGELISDLVKIQFEKVLPNFVR